MDKNHKVSNRLCHHYVDPSGYFFWALLGALIEFVITHATQLAIAAAVAAAAAVASVAYDRQQQRKFSRDAEAPPATPPPLSTAAHNPLQAAQNALTFPALSPPLTGLQRGVEGVDDLARQEAFRNLVGIGLAPAAAALEKVFGPFLYGEQSGEQSQ